MYSMLTAARCSPALGPTATMTCASMAVLPSSSSGRFSPRLMCTCVSKVFTLHGELPAVYVYFLLCCRVECQELFCN